MRLLINTDGIQFRVAGPAKAKADYKDKDQQAAQEAAAKLQSLENTESDKYARQIGADACVG